MSWPKDARFESPDAEEAYPAYPIEVFLRVPRDAIRRVVARVQAPESIVAMTALAVMSTACDQRVDVQMPKKLLRPVSLFFFGQLASSGRKTSAIKPFLAPLVNFDARIRREYEEAKLVYDQDIRLWRNLEKGIARRIHKEVSAGHAVDQVQEQYRAHLAKEPQAPRLRRILRGGLSERALYEALEGEREAIAALADEGETVLRGGLLDRLGTIDSIWNGTLPPRDRAYGKMMEAVDPRLTLLILLPSGVADIYAKKRGELARVIGFYARMLHAAPPSNAGSRVQTDFDENVEDTAEFCSRVLELLERSHRERMAGCFKPEIIHFTLDAADVWLRKDAEVEEGMRPGGPFHEIQDFAGKAVEIASRIAAIFHYFSGQTGDITVDTFERSWKIVEWHMVEFKRIFYERSAQRLLEKNVERLTKWFRKQAMYRYAIFAHNDVLQHNPLRTIEELRPALDVLRMKGAVELKMDSGKLMVYLSKQHFRELDSPKLFISAPYR